MTNVQAVPYPGLVPFQDTQADRQLFFGRERETNDLTHQVVSQSLSILYARSGIGKSSLINAGLMEQLRSRGFFPAMARLTQSDPNVDVTGTVIMAVAAEAKKRGLTLRARKDHGPTLWEFFTFTEFVWPSGGAAHPVLIIDQFEELFTVVRARGTNAETAFVSDFADLVRGRVPEHIRTSLESELETIPVNDNRRAFILDILYGHSAPPVNVLLSLREDYLPELESLRGVIPTIFQSTYRLLPLSRETARAAIEQPPIRLNAFAFEEHVVDEILNFLTTTKVGRKITTANVVEPAHLQIVCTELDRRRRRRKRDKITLLDLNGLKGMRRILKRYYIQCLQSFRRLRLFPRHGGRRHLYIRPRASVRRLCEVGLLTRGGHRNPMMHAAIVEQYDLTPADVQKLIDLRIVHADWRLDTQFIELSHDALVDPIRSTYRVRIWTRRALMTTAALGLSFMFILILGLWLFWQEEQQQKIGFRNELANARSTPEKGEILKKIAASNLALARPYLGELVLGEIDARKLQLPGLTFDGTRLTGALFDESEISESSFKRADLSYAHFNRATIRDTSFERAVMENVSFVGALLQNVEYTKAKARGADFSSANVTGTFAGADLTNARFVETIVHRETSFDGATVAGVDFTGTAWWLASGWSAEQVAQLRLSFTPDDLKESSAFHSERAYHDNIVFEAQRSLRQNQQQGQAQRQLAMALNNRAWFRAIRAVDLGLALADADQAVRLFPDIYTLDTRASIYLQLGRCEDAYRDLTALAALLKLQDGPPSLLTPLEKQERRAEPQGAFAYHYGLACEYTGRSEEAERWFAFAKRLDYVPTHELSLSPRSTGCNPVAQPRTMKARSVRLD